MNTYHDKLKDPRWQKRRLEVLERAGWKCQVCDEATKTLHVHHLVYNGDPWETALQDLEALCEDCHSRREYRDSIFGKKTRNPSMRLAYFWCFWQPVLVGECDVLQKGKMTMECVVAEVRKWHNDHPDHPLSIGKPKQAKPAEEIRRTEPSP